MKQMIWFDMDGTIANLYGVEGWLEDIKNEKADAYRDAKPMLNLQALARVLNRLEKAGYEIGVVSWLAKGASADYDEKVREAKKRGSPNIWQALSSQEWTLSSTANRNRTDAMAYCSMMKNRTARRGTGKPTM